MYIHKFARKIQAFLIPKQIKLTRANGVSNGMSVVGTEVCMKSKFCELDVSAMHKILIQILGKR